jgi:hypothetical protein
MNRVILALAVSVFGVASLPALRAAPANDNFANRTRLLGAIVSTSGNNDTATSEASEPIHWAAGNGGKSVWWTWTAPNTGPATFSTAGSTFDTLLAVYTGNTLTSLALVANNDNFGGGSSSSVSFNATAGTVYQIAVDGAGNPAASGNLTLAVNNPFPITTALVSLGATWKYLDNGSDQGTAWIGPGFNDTTWASGPAQLGYGDAPADEATTVSYGPDANNKYITTYFRRAFNVSGLSEFIGMSLRLIRDDGGIIYLNGQEIFRTGMPDSGVNYLTLATANGENTLDQASLDAFFPLLVNGANVLAAEIHQTLPTSSDISFDLELNGVRPFTNHAPNVVILAPTNNPSFDSPAMIPITVEAWDNDTSVTNVSFYSGATFLGRDTTHPYSFTWAGVNPGSYQLRAVATDNSGLSTTSAVANVTVTGVANTPPTVSVTSPANNATFDAPTNLMVTVNAADPGGTVTKLEYYRSGTKLGETATPPFTYYWTNALVGSFQLTAVATDNGLLTGTSAPVTVNFTGTGPVTLISTGSVWKYFDTVTGELPGWNTLGFDDSTWLSGPAELGYGDISDNRPEATVVGFGPDAGNKYITTYFRRTINVANPGAFSYLTFQIMRDDGAVVYVNGVEAFRDNMPTTPIAFNTTAINSLGGAAEATFLPTNVLMSLAQGPNVIAVEIHQQSPGSSDISFDLELIGNTGAVVNNPPNVALVSPSNNSTSTAPATITLSANASDSDGAVVKVEFFQNGVRLGEDTASPYSFTVGNLSVGAYAFYAIATDSFGGTNVSSTNTFYVTPSTPPTVASQNPAPGSVGALTQVTVNFTEPVDGVDATDLLINGGPATSVSGANAVYTFTFPQPMEGLVSVSFARDAAIVDRESTPRPFDTTGAGASWQYTLTDATVPAAVRIEPVATATVRSLTEIEVTFSEAVGGVEASDLRINGVGATALSGAGAGPYRFQFTQPLGTNVQVNWTNSHGIHDLAAAQNAFAGGSWTYHLNTNVVETNVVINEIMYHPSSELESEEYIELFNRGNVPVNLHGWRLTRGVSFTFTNRILPARGYLVVAANLAAFNARYPGVANVVGNWTGALGNSGEDIELENAKSQRVNLVEYADEGEWAVRQRVAFGGPYFGWIWADDHDGNGKSLELRNPAMPNEHGRNWAASLPNNGTPGTTNSVFSTNIPPLIVQGQHAPLLPTSGDPLAISARIIDEQTNGIVATLFYRTANISPLPNFSSTPMFDDGNHGDGGLNDGVYGATLPQQPNGRILEFYVRAVDGGSRTSTWPAAGRDVDGVTPLQTANAMLTVDDDPRTTSPNPAYWLIMTEPDRAMLAAIDGGNNAEMNTTLVIRDGTGTRVRYNISIRHRGASSRGDDPPNYRVSIPTDHRLNGYESFNLNQRFPYSQIAGSVMSLRGGLHSEFAFPVQVIENGTNRQPAGSPKFSHYVHIENIGPDMAAAHFPEDSDGNAYNCVRPAELRFLGSNFSSYASSGYTKQSNVGENDWSDLVSLTYALNNTPDAQYVSSVNQVANIDEWLRYFAVLSMVGFGETSIGSNGDGDDYSMYRGLLDPRMRLIPHDHDTDFGEGDFSAVPPNVSLFRMVNNPSTPAITRFLTHPAITPLYWGELQRQINGAFRPDEVIRLFDQSLGSWVDGATRDRMKLWASNRWAYVASQIITNLTIAGLPPSLNGYPHTTSSTVSLNGTANVVETRAVKVNGLFATWSALSGSWSINGLTLRPGINQLVVQSVDAAGLEKARTTSVIWYDDGTTTSVSGTIAGSQTWTAANGPYLVTGPITIGDGATLTVQPGTTVYLAAGVSITVSGTGRLLAEGTDSAHIRFTRMPGTAGTWGQIWLNGASAESRISYAEIEYAGAASGAVRVDNSILYLDHVTFLNTTVQYLALSNSSFIVRGCVFPSLAGTDLIHGDGLPASGYGILDGNWFGTTTGLNDIIDFSGGQRPSAILQVLNNVFTGASDDILDLDGADAHVENNIFIGAHQAVAGGDTASAVSAGASGGAAAEITMARNLIYDCDSAALIKEGSFYTLQNNTLVHLTFAAINFGEPQRGVAGGAGALLDGDIISDTPRLFANYTSAVMNVTVNRSLLPTNWPGVGNINGDPMLTSTSNITWQNIAASFQLRPGSPAHGTGPNGLDMGGLVPGGASISGEPISPTPATTATLTIGGPGVTAYRYRVNGGAYGAETPVSTPINLSGLVNGSYTVFVLARNSAGAFVDPTNASVSRTWNVRTSFPGLRFSEVLARNETAVPVGSPARFPDLVELVNAGTAAVNLAGWGVSDEADRPYKFTFPAGATLAGGQFLTLYADNESAPIGYHLSFSLKQEGDDLYLTAPSGMLVDSVQFGLQLKDYSIARMPDGSWDLAVPTLGAANVRARTGDARTLKINEWLTSGINPIPVDFIELFNADPLPVALGGLYLTDNPIGAPRRHRITPLSFIPGGGFLAFLADGDTGAGADHVNFSLSSERGAIALFAPNLELIDIVIYGPQRTDVSMGRQPNGSPNFAFFDLPSPGAPNPNVILPNTTPVINEVLAFNVSLRTTNSVNGSTNITTPDWVEIFNPSGSALNLTDMSITDDPANSRRFVFPSGVTLASLGYLRVLCDGDVAPSSNNVGVIRTGFGLKQNGGAVYLFDKLSAGGGQLSGVSYGVQAADFSIGRVPDGGSNWVLTLNTIGSANIAATLGSAANLKVNEWMADPGSGDDWFEIYNPNPQPVALGGLHLSDDLTDVQTRTKHRIAALSFIGINSDAVGLYGYQRFEADGAAPGSGPEHVTFSLKAGGEQLGLSTAAGVLIDGVTFGPQLTGVSEGRLPDGTPTIVSFPTTASPGDANYLTLTNVVINEALTHADPPFEDAIELRNVSGASVNIGDWYLSDARNKLKKYRIPTGTVLAANGFKVFYANQFNALDDPFAFELDSAKGDEIYLSQTSGGLLTGYRHSVKFGAGENAVSFGRYVTSALNNRQEHFVAMTSRTFGSDNPDSLAQFRAGTGLPNPPPKVGPVVIAEIMYHPPDLPGGFDDVLNEFIELRNITASSIGLFHPTYPTNTWRLRDAVSFDFPGGTVLPANGVILIVSFNPSDTTQLNAFRTKYGVAAGAVILGPYAGKLDNGGESVELYKPDEPQGLLDPDAGFVPYILVDKVKFSDTLPWPSCGSACGADGGGLSLQRLNLDEYGNDPVNWTAATPTPGPQGGGGDSDSDGMDDAWEQTYFGTLARNGQGDFDGDGMSDLAEYLGGTNPTQTSSALRLAFVSLSPVVFRFDAAASKPYTVEYKNSLNAPAWTFLQSVPAGAARAVQINDAAPAAAGRFYRVRTP